MRTLTTYVLGHLRVLNNTVLLLLAMLHKRLKGWEPHGTMADAAGHQAIPQQFCLKGKTRAADLQDQSAAF